MKKVLITGGNKGIGLEVTKLFLENNYEVIIIARDYNDFELNDNKNVKKIQYDLTDISGIEKLVHEIGSVDILINNAGLMNSLPYDNYPKEKFDDIMDLNLYAPIELINHVSKYMIKNNGGRIVNTASIAGQIGHPDIWYGITKAGIINATKSFAKILGS